MRTVNLGIRQRGTIVNVPFVFNAPDVLLVDHQNFRRFEKGESYRSRKYRLGRERTLEIPHTTHWYLIIGKPGRNDKTTGKVKVTSRRTVTPPHRRGGLTDPRRGAR